MHTFNSPKSELNKKIRMKKETFLLKHQLFTTIYQKKGQANFNEIVENIVMREYEFYFDIYGTSTGRSFWYIIKGVVLIFVLKADDPSGSPFLHKRMGPGEFFGEKTQYSPGLKFHSAKSVSPTVAL